MDVSTSSLANPTKKSKPKPDHFLPANSLFFVRVKLTNTKYLFIDCMSGKKAGPNLLRIFFQEHTLTSPFDRVYYWSHPLFLASIGFDLRGSFGYLLRASFGLPFKVDQEKSARRDLPHYEEGRSRPPSHPHVRLTPVIKPVPCPTRNAF